MRATAPIHQASQVWSGRLALQVEGDARQSFSSTFELRGQPQAGQLTLSTPLGSTLAVLRWSPGGATLVAEGQERPFDSLDALVTQVAGTALPVAALFDWLAGTATPVPGWQPELSQLASGRLSAQRLQPPPVAQLRVVLDR